MHGIHLDSHLTFKTQVHHISKKIKRSIGILLKLRHYVTPKILTQLYYSLIYPFLTYGIPIWGNTYVSTLKPLITLQKKAIRIITFSGFRAHTSPLYKQLGILKLTDLVIFHNALFMHDFHSKKLPSAFNDFFTMVRDRHDYNTRFAAKQSFCIPNVRTNYGKFSLRFQGPMAWNEIDTSIKTKSKPIFKSKFKSALIDKYQ